MINWFIATIIYFIVSFTYLFIFSIIIYLLTF